MLGSLPGVGGWIGRRDGNDNENLAHISNPEHGSLEKSL